MEVNDRNIGKREPSQPNHGPNESHWKVKVRRNKGTKSEGTNEKVGEGVI